MNNEDQFEQRLRHQPLRPLPPQWRKEILAAAGEYRRNAAAQPIAEDQAALIAGWRLIFARFPLPWASLAALWIVLIGVNLMMPGPMVRGVAYPPPTAVQTELWTALDLESADFEIIGRPLVPARPTPPAAKDAVIPQRPHSEHPRDPDVGETHPKCWLNTIA